MRALLDHSVPRGLRTVLAGVEVRHAFEMGRHELRNGDLFRAAERDGLDVLITSDKNIRHQNRLGGLRIAVLELGTNHCLHCNGMPRSFRSRWPIWDMVSTRGWHFPDRRWSAGHRLNAERRDSP